MSLHLIALDRLWAVSMMKNIILEENLKSVNGQKIGHNPKIKEDPKNEDDLIL